LAFGYDADVVRIAGPAGQNTIRQHAQNLIESLSHKREDGSKRPIIFAAHSLGGLVTEEAIRLANESPEEYLNAISMSVSAILFFGTPHSGSGWSTLADGLASLVNLSILKHSNRHLIGVLKRDSEQLASLQGSFSDLNRRRSQGKSPGCAEILIHCFHEELPVKGVGHVSQMMSPTTETICTETFPTIGYLYNKPSYRGRRSR
jgi:protein SERAC1